MHTNILTGISKSSGRHDVSHWHEHGNSLAGLKPTSKDLPLMTFPSSPMFWSSSLYL